MPPDEGLRAVSAAVRPAVLGRYLGDLVLALAALTLVPAVVALALGEPRPAAALAAAAAVAGGAGLLLRRLRAPEEVQGVEALVIATAIFPLAALLSAAPLAAAGGIPLGDALFEAVSGVTTTGLTAVAPLEGRTAAFFFTRAWMQWYGGLGIAALSLALLSGPGIAARRLGLAGMPTGHAGGSLRLRARRMLVLYAALTAAGVAALLLAGAAPFDAVTHALAALSTGGFSTHDASLAGLAHWRTAAVATALGLVGAVSLPLYDRARHEGWRALAGDAELRALCVACVLASALIAFLLVRESHMDAATALRAAPLLAVSGQTTTGFTPVDLARVGPAAKLVLVACMLAGGCLGSTAGGVKLLRVLVTLRFLQWSVRRARLTTHAVADPHLGDERLDDADGLRAAVVILLFLGVVGVSWLAFVAGGYAPLDSLFEVASATGTVGLSSGITRPALEPALKAVLCADMLLGRVEVVALLVVLTPGTWRGRRAT